MAKINNSVGYIEITGARENNLKNISLKIPRNRFTVITGLSGSGKSSLALDTIYSEGLRRYIECLSTYARQFLDRVDRPDLDEITGLPTAIAIESRNHVRNSRSTVGTTTEIYDYIRLLFSKIGINYCPQCEKKVSQHNPQTITLELIKSLSGKRAVISFPAKNSDNTIEQYLSMGFSKIYQDNKVKDLEEIKKFKPNSEIVVDRLSINAKSKSRIFEAIESAFAHSNSVSIHPVGEASLTYSSDLVCTRCNRSFRKLSANQFSFNSPQGACLSCNGFGNILELDPKLVIPNPDLSIAEGAIEPLTKPSFSYQMRKLKEFVAEQGIDMFKPYSSLSSIEREKLFEGNGSFPGIRGYFKRLEQKKHKMHVRVFLSKYRSAFPCPACFGSRLREEALWVKVGNKNIFELCNLSIKELRNYFQKLKLSKFEKEICQEILNELHSRIEFLVKVGLEYLTLSRLTRSLSGGEAQRINLSCQLGSKLTETLYILDEPSIGLHPRDLDQLISIIKELRNRNNTVIVVEHDFDMLKSSDYLVELGPEAGEHGGDIIYQGSTQCFSKSDVESYTKSYLTNEKEIQVPKNRRKHNKHYIKVLGASENNLKNIDVSIPLGTLTCVTGVSGSGKSSLINDVLYSHLARQFRSEIEYVGEFERVEGIELISDVVLLDQSPIGRSSRSNPVTYIKVYDEIRKVISGTLNAKLKGFKPSHFSFNVDGGRCEDCKGEGKQKIEMHFLADVIVTCQECNGKRFKKEILDYKFNGKNIDEILNLTVDESMRFFANYSSITRKLQMLKSVGLGYLRLGQPSITLSGGEAQRIKIARELSRKTGSNILYILDEPTVGLHVDDIKKLLAVLNKLVDMGNSIIVIEHNLDIIKSADHIIDLGPEGGDDGGFIVAEGTPENIAKVKKSHTGNYLKKLLH